MKQSFTYEIKASLEHCKNNTIRATEAQTKLKDLPNKQKNLWNNLRKNIHYSNTGHSKNTHYSNTGHSKKIQILLQNKGHRDLQFVYQNPSRILINTFPPNPKLIKQKTDSSTDQSR